MIIKINEYSDVPIYLQIRNQIVMGISSGELAAGEQLPTVRALSMEIGINTMTVSKAYQILKSEGYIFTDRKNGARVRAESLRPRFQGSPRTTLRILLKKCGVNNMSGFTLGLIMFICAVPTFLIMYFMMYPHNWKNKKRIYGVNNRPEFKTEHSAKMIDIIVAAHNKQATVILIVLLALSTGMLFAPVLNFKMMSYTILIYMGLVLMIIPFAFGNSELKKYKKTLGIVPEKVLYADLKNAGRVHALSRPAIIFANVVGVLIIWVAVLCDLNILPIKLGMFGGTFLCTGLVSIIVTMSFIMLLIAFMADNYRNEVISENSDINTNYNRAKKRNFANYIIQITWIDNIIALATIFLFCFADVELLSLIHVGVYLIAIMVATALFVKNSIELNKKYVTGEAKLMEDDDDYWLLGMFYYNPNDKRLNVEKRVGVGATINMAHPVGKVISAISGIVILGSILSLIYVGMLGVISIQIRYENDTVICHHMWDEYRIPINEIVSVQCGDLSELKAIRVAGTGMENVAKGNFTVNGENGCKLFLNPQAGRYIKIVTENQTYYISDNTSAETDALYEKLK